MCYNSILSSVNYLFDCFYSPGRDLGRGFFSSEAPNEKTKKTSYAYGAMTNASLKKTPTPVEIQVVKRAEDPQNTPESTENHDPIVPTSSNEEPEFVEIGVEYTRFYTVQAVGDVNKDEGDFVIG